MIVRDLGDAWQVVLQTDHAELSGSLAAAWRERDARHDSVILAAFRHDDGWAVWERSPLVDGGGKPVSFLEVAVPAHLAFYRACIAAVTDEDPLAGLLVSMHGAGIYRGRYGLDPGLKLTHADDVREQVDAFVAEQESDYDARSERAGVTAEQRVAGYRLLQLYDRLSLHFCMRDVATESAEIDGYTMTPAGDWRVRLDPYPFRDASLQVTLRRYLVPKQIWAPAAFREWFRSAAAETVVIQFEGGS